MNGNHRTAGFLLAGVAYLALMGSQFSGIYHPFTLGPDRSWLILVVFVAAHLALGASWKTRWGLALPAAIGIGGILAACAEHNPWTAIAVLVGIPTALLLIAAGRILVYAARQLGGRSATIVVAVGLYLAAAAPLIEATRENYNLSTARHLNPAMAQQLPLVVPALNSLCGELPASLRHEFRAQGQALIRETRQAGSSVVKTSYTGVDEDPGTHYEFMTVRALAEAQLDGLRAFPHCEPALQHALRKTIG